MAGETDRDNKASAGLPAPDAPRRRPETVQFAEMYNELRRMAAWLMAGERPGHTLQPTALVNELFLRSNNSALENLSKEEFFCRAAHMLREILVEHARRRGAKKRGGGARLLPLESVDAFSHQDSEYLIEISEAVDRLRLRSARWADLVGLKFFLGMTFEEISEILGVAVPTAKADWAFARAFLRRELSRKLSE